MTRSNSGLSLHFMHHRCVSNKAKFRSQDDEDVDVAKERRRVTSGDASTDIMRLENLTKVGRSLSSVYPSFHSL